MFPVKFVKFLRTPFSTEYKTFLISSFEDILNSFFANEYIRADFMRTRIETELVSKFGRCFKGQKMPPAVHIKPKIIQT